MAEKRAPHGNYDESIIAVNQLIWGDGFISPSGAQAVHAIVDGLDLGELRTGRLRAFKPL